MERESHDIQRRRPDKWAWIETVSIEVDCCDLLWRVDSQESARLLSVQSSDDQLLWGASAEIKAQTEMFVVCLE